VKGKKTDFFNTPLRGGDTRGKLRVILPIDPLVIPAKAGIHVFLIDIVQIGTRPLRG